MQQNYYRKMKYLQDIRKWLQPKNKTIAEPKKRRIEDDDDDDVIPDSPDVQIINKVRKQTYYKPIKSTEIRNTLQINLRTIVTRSRLFQ